MSGPQWLAVTTNNDDKAPFVKVADLGYTVYLGTNRGGYVSQGHSSLSAETDAAYWNFGIDGYAEDVVANLKAVSEDNEGTKGTYFGFSMGSAQMLVALSKFEAFLAQFIEKITLLAPCMLFDPSILKAFPTLQTPGTTREEFNKAGVFAYFGPNWDAEKICAESSAEAC